MSPAQRAYPGPLITTSPPPLDPILIFFMGPAALDAKYFHASSLKWAPLQGREPFVSFARCFIPTVGRQQVLSTRWGPDGPTAQQLPSKGDGLQSPLFPIPQARPHFLMGTQLSEGSPRPRPSVPRGVWAHWAGRLHPSRKPISQACLRSWGEGGAGSGHHAPHSWARSEAGHLLSHPQGKPASALRAVYL